MILKFVYGKEIHIYDLKQDESFTHACQKIRQMFKKLPEQFVLIYRNNEQLELQIDTNQQFDQLINNLQGSAKTIKLYITDVNNRKPIENMTKSEQKINEINEEKSEGQKLSHQKGNQKFEQESGNFIDLHEPNSETQNLLDLEQPSKKIEDKREFQQLNSSDEEEQEVEKEVQNYLRNKIQNLTVDNQRELDTNLLEFSDPNEIKNLGTNQHLSREFFSNQQEPKPLPVEQVKLNFNEYSDKQHFSHSSERKKIFEPYEPKKKDEVQINREHNVKCNMCNCFPIIGARYKCVVCQEQNMCQNCEQKYLHEHPMLKICFPHQTPISIKVQIPQLTENQVKQPQIELQKEDISQLNYQQRRQRILSMGSELSELLDIEFQQCANFINENQEYTKETLTQLLISRKHGKKLRTDKLKRKQNEEKGSKDNGIFANIKDVFKGFISK